MKPRGAGSECKEIDIKRIKMPKDDEIKFQIFDGRDYKIWKKRILLYLKWKKCDEPATRQKLETDTQIDWDEKNLKAMNYIYCSISNEQLEFVGDLDNALKIMDKFDELYLKESTALQICIRNRLDRMKLKDFEESSSFFSEFEKIINELRSAGAKVSDREKLDYMLKTLPDSLSYVGDLIDSMKESDRTCEFLKNKITMWETRGQSESGKKRSSVFKVERKDMNCHGCGKYGHMMRNCTNTCKGGSSGGSQWQGGAYQLQLPHGSNQQPRQHRGRGGRFFDQRGQRHGQQGRGYGQQGRGYGQPGRGYGSRGRGRGWQPRYDGAGQHDASYSYSEGYDVQGTGSFLTQIESDSNGLKDVIVYTSDTRKIDWILDSGCSDHIVNDDSYFFECENLKNPVNVKIGDGRILKGTKVGKILTHFVVNKMKIEITISNVFYVKEMDKNLISYARVTDENKIISVGNTSKIYNKYNNLIGIAFKEYGLYKISSHVERQESHAKSVEKMTQKEKFHRILGHVNFNYLNTMCKENLVEGMPENFEPIHLKCGTCIQNKMHNLSFQNNRSKAHEILDLVHTDVNGPHTNTGFDGSKYFLTFIDDYSKCALVYTLKSKSEVYNCFLDYINKVENLTGKKIKRLRCDNGKEYMNKDMYRLASDKGIFIEPCPPYVHELNGTAERYNRTIMNSARCLLSDSKLKIIYWPEIVRAAAYLKNRIITNTYEKKTPFEIFFGKKPNISNLKLYGSKVFVRLPEIKRNSKWDRKADIGKLVGYENVGYRVLVNNKIIVARHVDFIDENENLVGFKGEDETDDESIKSLDECSESNEIHENITNTENKLRRSQRKKREPERYGQTSSHFIYVNLVSADSPRTYEEALRGNDCDLWKEAMDREMNCLTKNKTWKLVEKPKNKKILDLKWVFTNKSNNRKKARLVVRGFQQKEVLEDLYSPVAKVQTLKLLLSYCCQYGLMIMQMDVETAFLNGTVKSEVFVKQPMGYDDESEKVCKLEKALYGLRESSRAWYECFDDYMEKLGFQRSESDYCLYIKYGSDDIIYLILFVDDLLICGKSRRKIDEVKTKLSNKFAMKDLGEVKTYLGINIEYDHKKCEMRLNQSDYIESLARQYNIENCKPYCTPMEQNLSLEPAQSASDDIKYRNLIGALLYVSSGTRLDVSYSVNYLSRFQNSYDETHYKYALRILKYLYSTRELKLTYKRDLNAEIMDCFVDADWAGDKVNRKSTTGFVIRFFGNVIYWKSRKQGSVTKSSTAAEYVALSESVSEIKFIKKLLKDFKITIETPIKIYEDNSGAIAIAKYGNLTKNSKYIEVHYHFVNECYESKEIDIIKVDSENNIADILTKALRKNKFEKFRSLLKLV